MVAAKVYLVRQLVKEFDVRWPQLAKFRKTHLGSWMLLFELIPGFWQRHDHVADFA